ncbi:MAG: hypothetical protein LAT67_07600 [Balneolales bacterium]|nr:hypothetical protein [Balneolales bacterium]
MLYKSSTYLFSGLIPFLLISVASLLFVAGCGNGADTASTDRNQVIPDGTIAEQVQFLVDHDRYEEALNKLKNEDSSSPEIMQMKRDTHLHYGNWLMYHAETIHMTERMPMALAHFRKVLEMDPENRQARANKQQIIDIYNQLGRPVPDGVAQ